MDRRTGRTYELPIRGGAINAADLRQIKVDEDDFGLMSYDPAFLNTANCRSAITLIDGDRGILRYRGYPIEELAEKSSFLEVACLLLNGELPDPAQKQAWAAEVIRHTLVHENLKKFIDGFHHDAHPMGILVSSVAARQLLIATCRSSASSPRCGLWPPSHTGTQWVFPTHIRMTSSATRAIFST